MFALGNWIHNNIERVTSLCVGVTMFYWLEQGETIGMAFFLTMITFWFPLIVIGLIAAIIVGIEPFTK